MDDRRCTGNRKRNYERVLGQLFVRIIRVLFDPLFEILVFVVFVLLFDGTDADFKNLEFSAAVPLTALRIVGPVGIRVSGNGF